MGFTFHVARAGRRGSGNCRFPRAIHHQVYAAPTLPCSISNTLLACPPPHIVDAFEFIPVGGLDGTKHETMLYGPITALLVYLFPPSDSYVLTPPWKKPPELFSIDFAAVFVVELARHPVFFLEVKAAGHFFSAYGRALADDQMRARFKDLVGNLAIPTLYGVSLLGPHLS
jgi:hypothetical protein